MLTDSEKAFMTAGRANGYSDDELVAKVKERRNSSGYKLTDYAGEAAKLPASRLTEAEKAGLPIPKDDSGENVITRLLHRALPETKQYTSGEFGHGGEPVPAAEDAVGHDPLAAMVLASQLGGGAGALVKGLGPIVAGGVNGATQSAIMGGNRRDIAEGGAMGAVIPAIGAVARPVARGIRKLVTESPGGQARQLWEKNGGNVGPLDSGSGVSEIEGMAPTRRNVGEASRVAAQNVRKELSSQFEENTGKPYRAARAAVESPQAIPDEFADEPTAQLPRETMRQVVGEDRAGSTARGTSDLSIVDAGKTPSEKLRDISPLRGRVAELLYDESTPTAVKGHLRQEMDHLDSLRGADGRVMVTEASLDKMRQRLNDDARYGVPVGGPGTGNLRVKALRDIAATAQDLVNEGPYAEANSIYRKGMTELERDRGLMSQKAPKEGGRPPNPSEKQIAQWIRSRGADSEAAGSMYQPGSHDAFLERHPELSRQLDLPDLLRAKDKLQFSLGSGGTDNLIQATARGGGGMTHKLIDIALHNANAAAGRLAYRPAQGLESAAASLQDPMLQKLMAALAAQRQLEEERAQALGR